MSVSKECDHIVFISYLYQKKKKRKKKNKHGINKFGEKHEKLRNRPRDGQGLRITAVLS